MMQSWLLHVALMYIVEELVTVATTGDWTGLKISVDAQVRAAVPGARWDDTCVRFVNKVVDAVHETVTDRGDVLELAADLAGRRYGEAVDDLKKLVADHWVPSTPCADGAAVLAACKAA